MLVTKYSYVSNITSNTIQFNTSSSAVPDSLFELMKNSILVVNNHAVGDIGQSLKKE